MQVARLHNGQHIMDSDFRCQVAMEALKFFSQYRAVSRAQPVHPPVHDVFDVRVPVSNRLQVGISKEVSDRVRVLDSPETVSLSMKSKLRTLWENGQTNRQTDRQTGRQMKDGQGYMDKCMYV